MSNMMDPGDDPNNPANTPPIVFEAMVAQLAKPGDAILGELTPEDCHLLHMAVGISGEVAELSIATTKENIIEELGDIEFYMEGLRQGLGITWEQVITSTFICATDTTLVSAAGDILDQVKKRVIYRKPLSIHDIICYLAIFELKLHQFAIENGDITRDMCLNANTAKLGKRYKGHNYSDDAAQQRADKQ